MRTPYNNWKKSKAIPTDRETIYHEFLKTIIEQQSLWGIATDHWTLCATASGEHAMPVWSIESIARSSCYGDWQDSQPQRIDLTLFMQDILPYLQQKQLKIAIDRSLTGDAIFVHPELLLEDIIPVQ